MIFNKYLQFGLSALGGLAALASSLDWSGVLSPRASAGVAAGVLVVKGITNVLAPAPGTVAAPTGGTVVTHS